MEEEGVSGGHMDKMSVLRDLIYLDLDYSLRSVRLYDWSGLY